jgi:signal transduction histidine kinase
MDLRPLIGWMETSTRHRNLVTTYLFLGLLAIGVADSVTGSTMSYGVFYVLIVVAVTVVAGARMGFAGALLSAVAWGTADIITSEARISISMDIWNLATRFAVHVIVVLLIAAVFEALRAARESDARSRAFLATAAHQLRTPIAALSASVEALLLQGSTPSQERLLANVAGETSRLGRLAGSLLRTARLDQGETLHPQATDLRELLRHEVDRARQLSVVEYRLTVQPDVPDRIVLDPDATTETITNLLDNARRHATTLVVVAVSAAEGQIIVEVWDDGPGLPTGAETRAFDRFVTLDGRGGTGLGLAIARELAQRQGGDLAYDGKAFVLTVPLHQAGEAASSGRRTRLRLPLRDDTHARTPGPGPAR